MNYYQHREVSSFKLSPYFKVVIWILEHWITLFSTALILILVISIFNRFISPMLHEKYKNWLDYHETLILMKKALEGDYTDLWSNPDFCLAFLKFYEEYQVFINEARLDPEGRTRRVSAFNKYQVINLCQ